MSEVKKVSVKLGDDYLVFETGKIAKQANGAVYAHYAGSAVIATVCCGDAPSQPLDYVPVSVEYNEKYYAAGKIPGGFLKREAKPKDKEILVSRLIDRPMRPLFDKAFSREIQIVPTVISTDQINTPDIIAINAASAAVTISDIPFNGPIAGVRVALVDGEYVINPTFKQIEESDLDIVVAGTREGITMVEGGAHEVSEQNMLDAIAAAQPVITKLCDAQLELRELAGKEKLPVLEINEDLSWLDPIREYARPLVEKASFGDSKFSRHAALKAAEAETREKFAEIIVEHEGGEQISKLFDDLAYEILRASILNDGKRVDGRTVTQIRPITCEVGVLARTHGSALFTRGETQSLAVTTLGTVQDEHLIVRSRGILSAKIQFTRKSRRIMPMRMKNTRKTGLILSSFFIGTLPLKMNEVPGSEDHVVGEDQEDDHRGEFGGFADGSGELGRRADPQLLRRSSFFIFHSSFNIFAR